MELGDLYQFILLIVLIGMLLGVGVITLSSFRSTPNIGNTTINVLDNVTNAMIPISSTWLPLIITVAVLAIILTLVIRSFAVGRR